ncbi:MAG: Gfo/Idh/MocA family oxidoreductase [Saprospiraceae bacterium]|nr:Gfo/Idh/MocA family oxidoreductase [Saprospiraceae bacterium]
MSKLQRTDRRKFLEQSAMAAISAASTRFSFLGEPQSTRKLRIGIVGGRFGRSFYFHEHPNCKVVAVSDLRPDRKKALMETYNCQKSYDSLALLLKDKEVEAVGIFTPAPDHATHVIQSLEAGKHVLCAVPAALTIDECSAILEKVNATGLTYMMAETSTYRQETITAKKMFSEGKFGTIFHSAAQYYHPGLEVLYFETDGSRTWRHGFPPMLYPTHTTAFLIAVTGERLTHVNAIGWGDQDPILKDNIYNNPFWNTTGFFQTDQGHSFVGEVCWKGALLHGERGSWYGDKMSFHMPQKGIETHWVHFTHKHSKDDGGFSVANPEMKIYDQESWWKEDLLPEALRHDSGHGGSHTFITHEFVDAIINDRAPEIDIYEALAYTAPGIVAHQSALEGGEYMSIPNFDV